MKYSDYANSIIFKPSIYRRISVEHCHSNLLLVGQGRSACVFRVNGTDKVIKVFPKKFQHLAKIEGEIYGLVSHIPQFPSIYEIGSNYIVIDYIEGYTLFECLNNGIQISEAQVNDIDNVLQLTRELGLNPSDIHLRNILITADQKVKLIDVARFKQTKPCKQWQDLKTVYFRFYHKRYFPKKIPSYILDFIGVLYKKKFIPSLLLRE